jgi:hypothetical protein
MLELVKSTQLVMPCAIAACALCVIVLIIDSAQRLLLLLLTTLKHMLASSTRQAVYCIQTEVLRSVR